MCMTRDLKKNEVPRIGTILRHKGSGQSYIVIRTHPIVAVRSLTVYNSTEWLVVEQDSKQDPMKIKFDV